MHSDIFIVSFLCACGFGSSAFQEKQTSGIVITEETGQILYEATAALIYQIPVPQWQNFLSLDISGVNCTSNPIYSKFCSVVQEFEAVSHDIKAAAQPWLLQNPSEVTHASTWGLKCNQLGQHFSSWHVDAGIVQRYLDFLRYCSPNQIVIEEELNGFDSYPDLTRFEDAYSTFESFFLNNIPIGNPAVVDAINLNFIDNLLSAGFSSFLAQSMRWQSAISKCNSGLLPDTLISATALHNSLQGLNETAGESGWKLSISPEEQFLPVYYKNQLADCTFSDQNLYVRVLIPMTKATQNWKHISVQSIAFYTPLLPSPFSMVRLPSTEFKPRHAYLYEETSQRLFSIEGEYSCTSSEPAFCKLPELWDNSLVQVGNCVNAVLSSDPGQIEETCKLGLRLAELYWPVVTREGTDAYYITAVPDKTAMVKCREPDGSESTVDLTFSHQGGTLHVTLPCFCVILAGTLELTSSPPCQPLSSVLNISIVTHPGLSSGNYY